ncbi:MAG: FtsQ-type POTRA domain-containing protein [Nitrosospira sp.]|nr:FtsQ-type POTRA domain-containing protein [Nitrosospira sp.]
MWDNHQTLDLLSNVLLVLAALTAGYLVNQRVLNLPVFPLKEAHVGGSEANGRLRHVTREQIAGIVQSEVRGNFFTVDLEAVRNAFKKLPWVRIAAVRRVWPQGLEVTLEEHVALASWGSNALVNVHGEVFNAAPDERLPLFEGPEGSSLEMARQHAVFNTLLEPLQQNIKEMNLSARRAWRLRLESGMVLELGREQMEPRLERYVLVHGRSSAFLAQQLSYVDLRYPGGFAAR